MSCLRWITYLDVFYTLVMNAKFYVDKIFFFFLYRKTKIMLIINMLFAIKFGTHNFSRLFLKNIFLVDFNIYIYIYI